MPADEECVEAVRERWNGLYEASEEFDLRTPALSNVLEIGEEQDLIEIEKVPIDGSRLKIL